MNTNDVFPANQACKKPTVRSLVLLTLCIALGAAAALLGNGCTEPRGPVVNKSRHDVPRIDNILPADTDRMTDSFLMSWCGAPWYDQLKITPVVGSTITFPVRDVWRDSSFFIVGPSVLDTSEHVYAVYDVGSETHAQRLTGFVPCMAGYYYWVPREQGLIRNVRILFRYGIFTLGGLPLRKAGEVDTMTVQIGKLGCY